MAARIGHREARRVILEAYREEFGEEPTPGAAQGAQGVSLGESHYGSNVYKRRGVPVDVVHNNWGGVQCRARPPCPPDCFEATDTHEDGTPYEACFRIYPSPEAGARAFLRALYGGRRGAVLEAANRGDLLGFARTMRETDYYELPLDRFTEGLEKNVSAIARALEEPVALRRPPRRSPSGTFGTLLVLGALVEGAVLLRAIARIFR